MKRGAASSANQALKLTMDMFRSRTKTGKREAKNLLFPLAQKLTGEGIIEKPKWLQAMERVHPANTAIGMNDFLAEKKERDLREREAKKRATQRTRNAQNK
jgi:hypothetical protein